MVPSRRGRVIVVGSLNLDHTVTVERLPPPGATVAGRSYSTAAGGKGLNQAVAAARQGADVVMVGAVGDDPAGGLLAGVLAEESIDVEWLRRVPGPSGTALVTVDAAGANTIVVVPGANGALDVDDVPAQVVAGAAVVVCQLEVRLAVVRAALEVARRGGAFTILNPAPAPGPLPDGVLELVDLVVPNEVEAAALVPLAGGRGPLDAAGAAGRALVGAGAGAALVTLGSRGALLVGRGTATPVGPLAVRPVDPTAAGDAFVGALAAALAAGDSMAAATRRAAAAGALATTRLGAVPSLPDRRSVDRALAAVDAGKGSTRFDPAGSRSRPSPAGTQSPGPRRPPPSGGPAGGPAGPTRPRGSRG